MQLLCALLTLVSGQPPRPSEIFESSYREVRGWVDQNWWDFKAFVDALDSSLFQPFWEFCHEECELEDDAGLDRESFIGCGEAFSTTYGEYHESFPHWGSFLEPVWEKADWNDSGFVDWDEWRYTEAVLGGVYANVSFQRSGKSTADELTGFQLEISIGFTRQQMRLLRELETDRRNFYFNLWNASQVDENSDTADKREISLFWINFWNFLITKA
ncbi:Oidioi.mRNA.OKI2018_I69.chr1.g2426.t1.cds [Oikopleura dioica]|uniref:Oidioi.mRNA.OKI2018_I69.chr1.g2426.t1.cds n=1 Tax=Oikopleura dioica TaxID=34765 RepID=A0ABN7SR30_OIKDI|nr:Oidioi.mRNA.OKI2018_I69.chr1.g2426.t1.cds [Oikopleura dioica]